MRNTIDIEKLSLEMNDALMHREAVMRSGSLLAQYLIGKGRNLDAMRLIGRCSVHDISKIQNTEEFMSLASVVTEIDSMHDIGHVPDDRLKNAIRLHQSNNRHHPEYYEDSNDMTDLDLLEMACDCHARSKQFGTDLLEYISVQQDLRFHFDRDHLHKLKVYCLALVALTKHDNYQDIFANNDRIKFSMKDSTMESLETFNGEGYLASFKTDRLFLVKDDNPDFASVVYSLYLRDGECEIGNIFIKCDGTIEYNIYTNYKGQGFAMEAISKLIEVSSFKELRLVIKRDNDKDKQFASSLGFQPLECNEHTLVYRLKKNDV